MGSVSKHLFKTVSHTSCCHISHPWSKSCIEGYMYMLTSSFKGTAKFYLTLYVIQYFIKNKTFSFDALKETIICFIRESCFGALMGSGFVGAMCLFRHTLKRFRYYTIALVPGTIGGTAVFLIDPTRRGFAITTFQYLVLEIIYNTLQEKGVFKKTITFETLFFMICSSGLLYLLRHRKTSNTFLWFFSPSKVQQANEKHKGPCSHSGQCWKGIIQDTLKYFLFGLILQLGRNIFVSVKTHQSLSFSKLLFSSDTYLLGMFTGSYVLIYKIILCSLCQWFKYDSAFFALPAGFIAGAAYSIQPNITIALIALTNLLKISMGYFIETGFIPNLPWQEISFIVNSGIILHTRTMHPQICPKDARNLINTMTGMRADEIYHAFKSHIDQTKLI